MVKPCRMTLRPLSRVVVEFVYERQKLSAPPEGALAGTPSGASEGAEQPTPPAEAVLSKAQFGMRGTPAVVGQTPPPPNSPEQTVRVPDAPITEPYLQMRGTLPITGQTSVLPGDEVLLHGSGFCGAPGCSPVTVTVGDRQAVSGVPVDADGRFWTAFTVSETYGRYLVRVSQTDANGSVLADEGFLDVHTLKTWIPTQTAVEARMGRKGSPQT